MALSAAMQWALNNGMTEADVYQNINDFLATNPSAAQTQAQMAQFGISPEDVAAATGGKSGGMLSGNIMAGASWNSTNTALQDALTQATGQQTSNYAVGGSTTSDTLNQLNTFLAGGGQFDPNATVYLQAGGVDFIQGVDKGVVKDNLNQIVKTLGDQGVNVVLTGSPYAASVQDVIDNKFNPEVDQIYNDVAKANSNVALVNTQGEILQNKDLLVDALHTNAAGTAIYNQSVIDALSQFKNEVPPSTPQAITQAQRSNVIPTARGTVIEGDDIEAQMAGVPQVVYETRVDPNNPANWETYNPKTGEVINSGTFAGGGDRGLLAAAAPVIGLAASTVGLPGITGLLGNLTGTTGSTLAGLTGATIGGGTTALAGGTTEDILKGALLAGGASYGSSLLDNYLATGSIADPGITERQLAIADAKQLADQGLSQSQIADVLGSSGYNEVMVDSAIRAATKGLTPTTIPTSTAATDVVNITGTATPAINAGGLLGSLVPTTVTPTVTPPSKQLETVKVTGTSTPQQVDQAVLNLINSQLASNVTTPANLANVQVTGNKPTQPTEVISSLLPAVTPTINTPAVVSPSTLANVQVTGDKGMMSNAGTTSAILNTIAGLPTTPATTNNLANVTVTGQTPATTQELVSAITAATPTVTTPTTTPVATQTITAQKPATQQEIVNAITATIPTVTPAQATTIAEQVITSGRPVTTQEVISAITATLPAVTTPVTTPTTTPEVKVTAQKPTSINDIVTAAAIPLIQPSVPLEVTPVTAAKTNELGLTDAQMANLLKAGLGLFGGLGGAAALSGGGGGTTTMGGMPTQLPPMYTDDYFTRVQQNYNQLLPAVPRDVATPLRDWYTSQYGA